MSVPELFQKVREIVQTGLVEDIPWLPNYQAFAGEAYIKPKDFEDRHLHKRISHLKYALGSIEKGAAELPGEGSALEKTVRTMNGLDFCKNLVVMHAVGSGLVIFKQEAPTTYIAKAGTLNESVEFLDPTKVAHRAKSIIESLPLDSYIQDITRNALKQAGKRYYPHTSRWSLKTHYYGIISDDSKKALETMLETPEIFRVTDEALQRMKEIGDGKYGLPLSEIKNFG